jgi:hypothetical protein
MLFSSLQDPLIGGASLFVGDGLGRSIGEMGPVNTDRSGLVLDYSSASGIADSYWKSAPKCLVSFIDTPGMVSDIMSGRGGPLSFFGGLTPGAALTARAVGAAMAMGYAQAFEELQGER